jgi:hypothetical protein
MVGLTSMRCSLTPPFWSWLGGSDTSGRASRQLSQLEKRDAFERGRLRLWPAPFGRTVFGTPTRPLIARRAMSQAHPRGFQRGV